MMSPKQVGTMIDVQNNLTRSKIRNKYLQKIYLKACDEIRDLKRDNAKLAGRLRETHRKLMHV